MASDITRGRPSAGITGVSVPCGFTRAGLPVVVTVAWYHGDRATRQLIGGDLRVRYPIVGGLVERALVIGLREHVGEEARILERWLRDSGAIASDTG